MSCVAVLTSNSFVTLVSGQGTFETTLLPRDLDRDLLPSQPHYNTDLDINRRANT